MIKLITIELRADTSLLLHFSNGAWGIHNFAPFVKAVTVMTAPLRDPALFARHFIEAGALVWPNGLISAQARCTATSSRIASCTLQQKRRKAMSRVRKGTLTSVSHFCFSFLQFCASPILGRHVDR
jgi:hypothetical protein